MKRMCSHIPYRCNNTTALSINDGQLLVVLNLGQPITRLGDDGDPTHESGIVVNWDYYDSIVEPEVAIMQPDGSVSVSVVPLGDAIALHLELNIDMQYENPLHKA